MSIICPTILAGDAASFQEQAQRLQPFASRVQIDLADGDFAPTQTISPVEVRWPENWAVDIHLMYRRPVEQLEALASLAPQRVIIHAEAEGDLLGAVQYLQKVGIKTGVALLRGTVPESVRDLIMAVDHVLIFSGDLGKYGGKANLLQLEKVRIVKKMKPELEIGWDGGANLDNVYTLALGGVDVINVGGAIANSKNPAATYAQLSEEIKPR